MNRRPLLVRFGALGDMVILTVAIRHLHRRFGLPVDILSSGGWSRSLLEGQPGVGDLFVIGSRKPPYWLSAEQQRLVGALRERGASPTWLFDHDNRKTCRLLERAGWTSAHWCHYEDMKDVPGPHFCDTWLRFAYRNPPVLGGEDLPLTATDAYGELTVTEGQRTALNAWLHARGWACKPLILVQVGNKRTMRRGFRHRSSNSKYWPEANWAALLRELRARHPDHAILMLGVPQEAALNNDILNLAKIPDAHNVADELPIPRLMALADRAVGLVSVDTGPAHVAAAVGCPVVALFGESKPSTYAPRGKNAPVHCVTSTSGSRRSVRDIHPDAVLAGWMNLRMQTDQNRSPACAVDAISP